MDYLLVSAGAVFILLGLAGCILPVLPGPPLSFIGFLMLHFSRWGSVEIDLLVVLAIAASLATAFDYVLPIWATKKFGGSKRGVWGATLGLVVGLFFFPPLGIIIGPFAGAYIGEITDSKNNGIAIKSALGSFVGFLMGTGLKFAVSGAITYYYVVELFIR